MLLIPENWLDLLLPMRKVCCLDTLLRGAGAVARRSVLASRRPERPHQWIFRRGTRLLAFQIASPKVRADYADYASLPDEGVPWPGSWTGSAFPGTFTVLLLLLFPAASRLVALASRDQMLVRF